MAQTPAADQIQDINNEVGRLPNPGMPRIIQPGDKRVMDGNTGYMETAPAVRYDAAGNNVGQPQYVPMKREWYETDPTRPALTQTDLATQDFVMSNEGRSPLKYADRSRFLDDIGAVPTVANLNQNLGSVGVRTGSKVYGTPGTRQDLSHAQHREFVKKGHPPAWAPILDVKPVGEGEGGGGGKGGGSDPFLPVGQTSLTPSKTPKTPPNIAPMAHVGLDAGLSEGGTPADPLFPHMDGQLQESTPETRVSHGYSIKSEYDPTRIESPAIDVQQVDAKTVSDQEANVVGSGFTSNVLNNRRDIDSVRLTNHYDKSFKGMGMQVKVYQEELDASIKETFAGSRGVTQEFLDHLNTIKGQTGMAEGMGLGAGMNTAFGVMAAGGAFKKWRTERATNIAKAMKEIAMQQHLSDVAGAIKAAGTPRGGYVPDPIADKNAKRYVKGKQSKPPQWVSDVIEDAMHKGEIPSLKELSTSKETKKAAKDAVNLASKNKGFWAKAARVSGKFATKANAAGLILEAMEITNEIENAGLKKWSDAAHRNYGSIIAHDKLMALVEVAEQQKKAMDENPHASFDAEKAYDKRVRQIDTLYAHIASRMSKSDGTKRSTKGMGHEAIPWNQFSDIGRWDLKSSLFDGEGVKPTPAMLWVMENTISTGEVKRLQGLAKDYAKYKDTDPKRRKDPSLKHRQGLFSGNPGRDKGDLGPLAMDFEDWSKMARTYEPDIEDKRMLHERQTFYSRHMQKKIEDYIRQRILVDFK